jgi:hypothetical protein
MGHRRHRTNRFDSRTHRFDSYDPCLWVLCQMHWRIALCRIASRQESQGHGSHRTHRIDIATAAFSCSPMGPMPWVRPDPYSGWRGATVWNAGNGVSNAATDGCGSRRGSSCGGQNINGPAARISRRTRGAVVRPSGAGSSDAVCSLHMSTVERPVFCGESSKNVSVFEQRYNRRLMAARRPAFCNQNAQPIEITARVKRCIVVYHQYDGQ